MLDTAAAVDELFDRNYGTEALVHFRNDEAFVLTQETKAPVLRVAGEQFPLDSLDRLEFIMTIEDHFSIDIKEAEVMNFTKRSEVIEFVDNLLGKHETAPR